LPGRGQGCSGDDDKRSYSGSLQTPAPRFGGVRARFNKPPLVGGNALRMLDKPFGRAREFVACKEGAYLAGVPCRLPISKDEFELRLVFEKALLFFERLVEFFPLEK
jgi:hypothetical protein